jgi:hypothetical protein
VDTIYGEGTIHGVSIYCGQLQKRFSTKEEMGRLTAIKWKVSCASSAADDDADDDDH